MTDTRTIRDHFEEWCGEMSPLADEETVKNLIWALSMCPELHRLLDAEIQDMRNEMADDANEQMVGFHTQSSLPEQGTMRHFGSDR